MVFKADASGPKAPAKTARKVARPRNAFILYRGDWHAETVRQNPGMHNNQISKIIGNQWRFEDGAIKQRYKELAEEEKRQHAIDHPGYQYQPRKPHEKKKRMSKKKLAAAAEK
ncbi:HMG-box, partial [Polychaeton citri CBS 116435]